jgi:hypothetical protein
MSAQTVAVPSPFPPIADDAFPSHRRTRRGRRRRGLAARVYEPEMNVLRTIWHTPTGWIVVCALR